MERWRDGGDEDEDGENLTEKALPFVRVMAMTSLPLPAKISPACSKSSV